MMNGCFVDGFANVVFLCGHIVLIAICSWRLVAGEMREVQWQRIE